jgi:pilus assembly protein CpaB
MSGVLLVVALLVSHRSLEAPGASSLASTVPVVVAARDIPEGVAFDPMSVVVAHWPVPAVPAGAFSSVDSVVGRTARVAVFKGEALVPGRLAPQGAAPGLQARITPGRRAYGIRVNDGGSLTGLIRPGSHVDVMVVDDSQQRKRTARLFMSNIRVLAFQPRRQRGPDGRPIEASLATVDVTPREAEQLAIAAAHGSLALVLRGYGDADQVTTRGATSESVLRSLRRARSATDTSAPSGPQSRPRLPARRGGDSVFRDLLLRSRAERVKFQNDTTAAPQKRPR